MVIPADVRAAIAGHARAEDPNESCGLLLLRAGRAERYERARNGAASPYRFELEVDPELWFAEDEGYELAVVHSHLSSPAYPSRTDVENVSLWAGRPYFVYSVRQDDLQAFTITDDGAIERLSVADAEGSAATSPPPN